MKLVGKLLACLSAVPAGLYAVTIDPDRYDTMMQLSPSSFQRLDDYRSSMTPKLSGFFVAADVHAPGSGASTNLNMPFRDSTMTLKQAFNSNFGAGGALYGFNRRIFANFGVCLGGSNLKTELQPNVLGTTQSAADASGRREFYRDISIPSIETNETFGYGEIGVTDYLRLTAGTFSRIQPLTSVDANGRRVFDYAYTSDGTVTNSTRVSRNLYGVNLLGVQLDSLVRESQLNNLRGYYGIPIGNGTELRPIINYFRFQDKYQVGMELFDLAISKRFRLGVRLLGSRDRNSEVKFSMGSASLRWYFYRGVTTEFTITEPNGSQFKTLQTWNAYLEATISYSNDFGISGKTGYALGAYFENFPFLLQKFFVRYDYNYYNSLILLPFEDTIQAVAGVVWGFSETWFARMRELPQP